MCRPRVGSPGDSRRADPNPDNFQIHDQSAKGISVVLGRPGG